MGNRLWSDIQDSAARRYWFDLDSSPGVCMPGVGYVSLNGGQPQYPGTVFRTPATLILTFNGQSISQGIPLVPTTGALNIANSAVGQLGLQLLISPVLPPADENPPTPLTPTIIYVNTITPSPATLTLIGYNHSLSEGGNIGFLSPPKADLSLFGYQYTRVIPPAPPEDGVDGQLGTATLTGLSPTLELVLVIEPEVGVLAMGSAAQRLDRGFIWIDDDPAPPLTWSNS
jgi:hypothetical protein